MRKADLLVLVLLVAAAAAVLRPTSRGSAPTPTTPVAHIAATASPALLTQSGRWEVLPCRFGMAGRSDRADLHLTLLEGRLIGVGGGGRWALTEEGTSRPGFQSSEEQVRTVFGEPQRRDKAAWIYNPRPGELTFHFDQGRVSQVWITTEIVGRVSPNRGQP